MPLLRSIVTVPERVDPGRHPFNIPCLANGLSVTFKDQRHLLRRRKREREIDQLSFLAIIHDLEVSGQAQFIIATHSPIILSYPGATILNLDEDRISEIEYKQTNHYKLTREFLESPERYFRHLFADLEEDA